MNYPYPQNLQPQVQVQFQQSHVPPQPIPVNNIIM